MLICSCKKEGNKRESHQAMRRKPSNESKEEAMPLNQIEAPFVTCLAPLIG